MITRMTKAAYLKLQGNDIVLGYGVTADGKRGRIFSEINGQKFKPTQDDQILAGELIDELFGFELDD